MAPLRACLVALAALSACVEATSPPATPVADADAKHREERQALDAETDRQARETERKRAEAEQVREAEKKSHAEEDARKAEEEARATREENAKVWKKEAEWQHAFETCDDPKMVRCVLLEELLRTADPSDSHRAAALVSLKDWQKRRRAVDEKRVGRARRAGAACDKMCEADAHPGVCTSACMSGEAYEIKPPRVIVVVPK